MKKITAILLTLVLALTLTMPALAATDAALDSAVAGTAAYILKTVKNPIVDSVGGEWAVLGLARSGYDVPDGYYEAYYETVEKYVKDCGGVLHTKKYTEYSRVILALTAAGYDPRDVAGYDLTLALGDFEKTIWQGINGPIFALIALDSGNYAIPKNPDAAVQATRDMYIAEILRRQLSDGGWNLTADGTDPTESSNSDLTGMALQALANYQDRPEVKAATDKALECLSKMQDSKGGYAYNGSSGAASESVVQVLVAVTALGISVDDPRFVKDGNTLVDNILSYKNADGSFNHTADGSGNSQMSTEQAFYGLISAQRARDGKNRLYNMTDAVKRGETTPDTGIGLPDKHGDVAAVPVTTPGKTFADIAGHENKVAVEALAERGIINGKSDAAFDPDATMTRAEFAAIVVRGLGLTAAPVAVFDDVADGAWYAGFVGTAYTYGIVTGTSATTFNPNGTITKQEAAVMVARAAILTGMDTELDNAAIRDTLAQFGDYTSAADWARAQLAFCYNQGLLDDSAMDIEPLAAIRRCEIAEILYRLLDKSNLLK